MKTSSITTPNIKWAQRKEKLYVTIDVVGVKNPQIDIVDGKILKFQGTDESHKYAFELELYDEVQKEESKFSLDARNIFLNIHKKNKGAYWPRLTKGTQKLNWVGVDWTYYIDEDDEDEETKGPNMANEHNFPGFGGFGGMGDEELNDEDDLPDADEEDHVHGENCNHDQKKANLDDLDQEASK
jgi:prostaglandin-E synthase